MKLSLLLTCEHAGNEVPRQYAHLFRGAARALASHRGWDPGSRELGRIFQRQLKAPLNQVKTTRLLVELNRGIGHPRLFSEFTSQLDAIAKQEILDRYYHPHRASVEAWIAARVAVGDQVIHLSLHTFKPSLDGAVRNADVGLLYDPQRPAEKALCRAWRHSIQKVETALHVRSNYPYRGNADGFTTYLRRQFADPKYVGIELEVNQKWLRSKTRWNSLAENLAKAFSDVSLERVES